MDSDILKEAHDEFDKIEEFESKNRANWVADMRFAKLGEQWPEEQKIKRDRERRPCLTINRLPAFIRQVTNDARMNKPAITCHPVGDGANKETANILNGLIRNIEYSSNADVAYDTALEHAVTGGFGYFRISTDYAHDDSFDQDLRIERIVNPLSVYGDRRSTAADSADWNVAFVTDIYTDAEFKAKWPGAEKSDFAGIAETDKAPGWMTEAGTRVAEYWTRDEKPAILVQLSDGTVMHEDQYLKLKEFLDVEGITVVGSRPTKTMAVKQRVITGRDVLETNKWAGRYIPIIPVYGDEVAVDGERHFIGLIHNAKDSQQMFNYWRPLALDTPIPTPTGWKTMASIKVGDRVLTESGLPCEVIGESPTHLHRECFRVSFDDGTSIVADASHPWPVEERVGRTGKGITWASRLARTDELRPGAHYIKTPKPLDLPDAALPIHPYMLGVWLGDGTSASAGISQSDGDIDELRFLVNETGYVSGKARRYSGRAGVFTVHGLSAHLRASGLLNNKHIPAAYLRASRSQREALLQGLMDTDGSIDTKGQCSYTSTIPELSRGFAELLRTLGIKAVVCKRVGRVRMWADGRPASEHADADQFSFTPSRTDNVFRLSRKLSLQKRERKEHLRRAKRFAIRSVERVSSVPVKCIAIDAPSHLFLAGLGMVPTHNTASTELVALAPRAPWLGRRGFANSSPEKWATANTDNHAYLEYEGPEAPQRQAFTGPPAGALQEAMNATDDMKSVMGLFDASLGARSNETSGVAINARKREGDVSTFNFVDNLSRAIRHAGRVLVDMIPHVYNKQRIIRVIHQDGDNDEVPINQPIQVQPGQPMPGQQGPQTPMQQDQMQDQAEFTEGLTRIYDLTTGKYDITCESGPSFNSKREEAAVQMTEFVKSFPDAAPVIGDLIAKNLDWPGADEIGERLKRMLPPAAEGPNPQLMQMQQQMQMMDQQAKDAVSQLQKQLEDKQFERDQADKKLKIDWFNAQTNRLKAETDAKAAEADAQTKMMQAMHPPVASGEAMNQQ